MHCFSWQSENAKSFLCKCSFIEIYNEQIYDLLDSASASLFLRENIKKGVFVEGAVEKFVTSAAEAYQVVNNSMWLIQWLALYNALVIAYINLLCKIDLTDIELFAFS